MSKVHRFLTWAALMSATLYRAAALPALLISLLAGPAGAQTSDDPAHPTPVPVATAARLEGVIAMDGRLEETAWELAVPSSSLRQYQPDEGEAATFPMEVRVLYDAEAIYIGARLNQPGGVVAPLARRDQLLDANGNNGSFNSLTTDKLIIRLDPYHNHLDDVWFEVNPQGVKGDQFNRDPSWDPIWEAATQVDSEGWSAEMRIPFSQLRFSQDPQQTWGFQIWRYLDQRNEQDMWSFRGRNEPSGPAFFGHLTGLEIHDRPRQLEVMPYVVSGKPVRACRVCRSLPRRAGHALQLRRRREVPPHLQPHARCHPEPRLRAGGGGPVGPEPERLRDLLRRETPLLHRRGQRLQLRRYELHVLHEFVGSERLLLPPHRPATPARRPRGRHLHLRRRAGQNLDPGSRQNHRPDPERVHGGVAERRDGAGGSPVHLAGDPAKGTQVVEPLTNYFVGRVKKEFRDGATTFGGILTSTARRMNDPVVEARLRSHAESMGIDWNHRWKGQAYQWMGSVLFSNVAGSPEAMLRTQESSAHYFQRPDRSVEGDGFFNTRYDPNATSLRGYGLFTRVSKNAGVLRWEAMANVRSPGFEVNDLAFLDRSDYTWFNGNIAGVMDHAHAVVSGHLHQLRRGHRVQLRW